MPLLADPLTERRLQARTRIAVSVFDGECYGHDYGSYGHEGGDTLWWYEDGEVFTRDPLSVHDAVLGGYEQTQGYIRGRYSPVNETISLIPTYDPAVGTDYNIPRDVFEALEATFPKAVEIEIF